jgi:hypothetical protein
MGAEQLLTKWMIRIPDIIHLVNDGFHPCSAAFDRRACRPEDGNAARDL